MPVLPLVLTLALSVSLPQQHQHEHGAVPEALGRVHFETSCDPATRAEFDRAVALLHSFWFTAAADAFTRVAERDPRCGVAWWGVAMSRWGNPFAPSRPPRALEDGSAAIQKARAAGAATERERAYIDAAAELFESFSSVPHRTRILNYERAMERLHARYPEDREGAAFYALAVNQTALPTDKTFTQQLKAAAILEKLFEEQPDHPGAAHYLIHAYDHPPLAPKALPAARRYAKIAPDAPHALHMPSHTFTRVGLWEDSVATNRASAEAARRVNSIGDALHALDYQAYAYLQMAQDGSASRVHEEVQEIVARLEGGQQYTQVGLFASTAIPARLALERGAWTEAARLEPRATPFPFIDAMTHYARALGAARSGALSTLDGDVAKLGELHAALVAKGEDYWAQQVRIQHIAAQAWAAYATRDRERALTLLREAADLEGSLEKAAITPGPLAPARELLGEMLLELGRPADALREFESVMESEPGRFRTTLGAARAAARAGDSAAARQHYAQLLQIAPRPDGAPRPELQEARDAVQGATAGR